MRIAVLAGNQPGEQRVALTPAAVETLVDEAHRVTVETGAGAGIRAGDSDYRSAGAQIAANRSDAIKGADLLVSISYTGAGEVCEQHTVVALLDPLRYPQRISELARAGATALSLDLVPRISRAQTMDVLSSMATVAGYQAALVAAERLGRMFPMMMTAAGTVLPARVLVIGAGVAGLQAIATARRIGAVVYGYDVRPAATEQITSLGAKAIDLGATTAAGDPGGYAKAIDEDEQSKRRKALVPHVAAADVVITTAAVPGADAPLILTTAMIEEMLPGSLIVDIVADQGGNCDLTQPDTEVTHCGVTILGPTKLESGVARTAAQMFANNLTALIRHLCDDDQNLVIDPKNEITSAMLVAHHGAVVHDAVKKAVAHAEAGEAGS